MAKILTPIDIEFSDETVIELTQDQYAELVAMILVNRCKDCPKFAKEIKQD